MWIIPKTLSHFVPDTEGLNLDLEERAWMCAQSLMWRSKPSAAPTWERRLKKGGWITHLSGRILKPSLHESFEEKYTASVVDIPVSHFRQQASEKEKKTQDTYGHTSSSTSGQLDLFGAFGKMSKDTPRWGYGESCPIWKKKVIDARGAYSQRKKLARHTKGNECSSWPTATSRDWKDSMGNVPPSRQKECKQTLGQRVAHWATPQASDHIEGARTANESNQKCLGRDLNQMENWPTPRAGNPGSRKPGTGGKILAEEAKKNWPTPRETMSRDATHDRGKCNLGEVVHGLHNGPPAPEKSSTSGKNHGSPKLNPNWVEQLMGLNTGWTDLGSWGMELSHKPQN